MDMRQLRYFLAVVTEGSVTKAAIALHMTQPPLSTAISQLEKDLGVELLVRSARGVRPTEAGSHLAAAAERLLHDLADVEQDLRNMSRGLAGKVTIAAVPTITWELLPEVMLRFLEKSPDVDVTITDPPPATVIEMVLRQEADVGIIATMSIDQLQESYRSQLHFRAVRTMPLLVALPPHDAPEGPEVSLTSLHDRAWIVPRRSLRIRSLPEVFDAFWASRELPLPAVRRVATLQTAIPLVASGLGVALVPESLRTMSHAPVALRTPAEALPPLEAALLWSADRPPSSATKALIDVVAGLADGR